MKRGIVYGLASAVLFGVSTPIAKILVGAVSPLMLAGLLYAGSGAGLLVVLACRAITAKGSRSISVPQRSEWGWLAGAILFGGVLGPVALMYGLLETSASAASLLLNFEGVFTALLAWFLFHEHFDRRIAAGMLAIVAGGLVLAWAPGDAIRSGHGALFIAVACLCWALDNNLTRNTSASDAVMIAGLKGAVAGSVNIGLAVMLGQRVPGIVVVASAAVLGFLGYGVSLVLFVLALRHVGSARAGAYFSVAPFFGAAVALAIPGESATPQLIVSGALMAIGVWLHVSERHEHEHVHEYLAHTHSHVHDEHHHHSHETWDDREPHTHGHVHSPRVHSHPHYPDIHHRHPH